MSDFFGEIEPSIFELVRSKRPEEMTVIAGFLGKAFDNSVYEKKTLALALEGVGTETYSSETLLKIRSYVQSLGEDMDFFESVIEVIVKVYRRNP